MVKRHIAAVEYRSMPVNGYQKYFLWMIALMVRIALAPLVGDVLIETHHRRRLRAIIAAR